MDCRVVRRDEKIRPVVEQYVRQAYLKSYEARIANFPATMIVDSLEDGMIKAAAGVRLADEGFLSECYLDASLEEILSDLSGEQVRRDRIIEVTTVAANGACPLARLIGEVTRFARLNGADWAVFTITSRLQRLLRHMTLPIVELCPAEASRISNPAEWGTYYETRPVVTVMQDRSRSADDLPVSLKSHIPKWFEPVRRPNELSVQHGL
jgi:hypothetical protein